jgi:hypothetical protein
LFTVIGANSIFIYMTASGGFIDYEHTAGKLFNGALKHTGDYRPLLAATSIVFVEWIVLYVMYRKKIFLRV